MTNFDIIEYTDDDVNIIKTFQHKSTLSKNIFDKDKKMIDEVRKKVLEISDAFIEFLGIKFFIHDITLTGSLANYNWSNYSDFDLHLIIDFENYDYPVEFLKEFFDAKKNIWNDKHDIKIKNYDVELYVQNISDEHYSNGVYSVLNNKWISEPKKLKLKINDKKILDKSDYYSKLIDDLIKKFNDGQNIEKQAFSLYQKIKNFRKSGLSSDGENSYENLTFKLMRRNGYIKKLLDLRNSIVDKNLTIKQ